ncbi:MAG TPA: glycosyltransferase family 87 protein [Bryobacteraceae bacterium]|nr:glycosyltransferase family 87 protein [Bryobacteraceae bacterium]
MEYRYPPVTYLLLFPLKWLPLRAAGVCWMLAAWTTAILSASLAIRIRELRFNALSIVACCAFMLAYVVLAIRYGNVQPFVIAWLLAALVLSETHPIWAGILLALAVTFKIWPIMFLPWFLRKARLPAALAFIVALLVLWLLPFPIFGTARYLALLHDWYVAVRRMGAAYSEFYYFPSQSLRGILLRYLTPVAPPLKTFPRLNLLSLSPRTAVVIWGITALSVYSAIVIAMLRSNARKQWAWDGAMFVVYSLLEPYAVKSGLISLGPAALIAASLFTLNIRTKTARSSRANALFIAACSISFIQAILQYKPWQRVLLTIGLDFWTEILLLAAFLIWIRTLPDLD